jgi:3-oxoacyl-[acyl-carrier protein] reductase
MTAVITGATKGIGRAIAERFAQAGFNLCIGARSQADLMGVKTALETRYKIKVWIKPADFAKKTDVILFAEFVKSNVQSVDVLVNNVGQYAVGSLFESPADKLVEQLNVNLMSAHYLTSAFMPVFQQQGRGHIFTIGSILSVRLRESAAHYTISKHALRTWHQLLFEYARERNIKATLVLPSSTITASWGNQPNEEEFIQPEHIAETIFDCYNITGAAVVDEISVKTISKKLE